MDSRNGVTLVVSVLIMSMSGLASAALIASPGSGQAGVDFAAITPTVTLDDNYASQSFDFGAFGSPGVWFDGNDGTQDYVGGFTGDPSEWASITIDFGQQVQVESVKINWRQYNTNYIRPYTELRADSTTGTLLGTIGYLGQYAWSPTQSVNDFASPETMSKLVMYVPGPGSPVGWRNTAIEEIIITGQVPDPTTCTEVWDRGLGKPEDLNQDCRVDLLDFAELVGQWNTCTDPQGGGCAPAEGFPTSSVILPGRTWDADVDASGEEVRTDYAWDLQKGDVTISYTVDLTNATLTTHANNAAPAYAPVRFGPLNDTGDAVDETYAIWVNNALLWDDASNTSLILSNGYTSGSQHDEYSFLGAFPGVYDGTDPTASGAGSYALTDASYKGTPGVHNIEVTLRYNADTYNSEPVNSAYMTIGGNDQVETGASPAGFDFIGPADACYVSLAWNDWDTEGATGGGTIVIGDITVEQDQSGFACGDWGYLDADLDQDCSVEAGDVTEMSSAWGVCYDPEDIGSDPNCSAIW